MDIIFARHPNWDAPRYDTLKDLLIANADEREDWMLYPSGLYVPDRRVLWFWIVGDGLGTANHRPFNPYRLGTAEQCARFADRMRIPHERVQCVAPDRIHGTCVRVDEPRKPNYRLVQAQSFPAWAGR